MLFKSSVRKEMDKYYKRQEQIRGRRLIDEEEIRKQLYLKGKMITDDVWDSIKFCLISTPIMGVIAIFFPPLAALPLIYLFFLAIVLLRYLKYHLRIKTFQEGGEILEDTLESDGLGTEHILHLHGKKTGCYVNIHCSDFRSSKQKAIMYASKIPTCVVAIIDEDGTGYWYDPIEEE